MTTHHSIHVQIPPVTYNTYAILKRRARCGVKVRRSDQTCGHDEHVRQAAPPPQISKPSPRPARPRQTSRSCFRSRLEPQPHLALSPLTIPRHCSTMVATIRMHTVKKYAAVVFHTGAGHGTMFCYSLLPLATLRESSGEQPRGMYASGGDRSEWTGAASRIVPPSTNRSAGSVKW